MTTPSTGDHSLLEFARTWVDVEGTNVRVEDALWLYLRSDLELTRAVCVGVPATSLTARLRELTTDVVVLHVARDGRRARGATNSVKHSADQLRAVLADVDHGRTVVHLTANGWRAVARDADALSVVRRFAQSGGNLHVARGPRGTRALELLGVHETLALVPVATAHPADGIVRPAADRPVALLLPEAVTTGEGVELRVIPSNASATAKHSLLVTTGGPGSRTLPTWIHRAAFGEGIVGDEPWTVRPPRGYTSQKTVFTVNRRDDLPPLVVKVTQTPRFNPLLENEARSLRRAHGLGGSFRPPSVVFSDTVGGLCVVGESYVGGTRLGASGAEDEGWAGVDALIDLALVSRRMVPPSDAADALRELLARHQEVNRPSDAEHRFLREEIDRVSASTVPFPAVFMHGDSSRFNLFLSGDRTVSAVDFERSEANGMPLWDLFYFARAMGKPRMASILEKAVPRYVRATELDPELTVPLFCTLSMWLAMREASRRSPGSRRRGPHGRALEELVRSGRQAAGRVVSGA